MYIGPKAVLGVACNSDILGMFKSVDITDFNYGVIEWTRETDASLI
jgi:hypothetical protein